ncbi:MAG: hypothetical protein OK457_07670 [Thaumarchaeota archaeon]|nr:hypothetical protein [Nitrososphaerota archaeon]
MREELGLSNSILTFEHLNEVLAIMDQSVDTHSKMIKRYEDRLGILLRLARESSDPRLNSMSAQLSNPSAGIDDRKKKDDRKKETSEEKGWITLESEDHTLKLAGGSDTAKVSNEISILFKVLESLKAKIPALEAARKLLSELPSRGFDANGRFRIVFKDGLPRYVLPSTEARVEHQKKFWYAETFRIAVLK